MADPSLSKPAKFDDKPHKKKRGQKPTRMTIFGKDIKEGDEVNVNGTRGQRPTNWSGTIHMDNSDGSYSVIDLVVDTEEVSKNPRRGGNEDVSVTVSNDNFTSDPVTTPNQPTVP
jgi:hypothetical protein